MEGLGDIGKPLEVLVVDDDKNWRLLLVDELTEEGYTVSAASSGAEALAMMKQKKPDLVILDIAMPGQDGIETMHQMFKMYQGQAMIFHSAYSQHRDNFQTWAANAYVVKNSDLAELKNKVREVTRACCLQ